MSNNERSYIESLLDSNENKRLFLQARAIRRTAEMLEDSISESGVSRSDLADQLNISRGRVSQLLDGEQNLTIRTVADVLAVQGQELCLSFRKFEIGRSHNHQLKILKVSSWTQDWDSSVGDEGDGAQEEFNWNFENETRVG